MTVGAIGPDEKDPFKIVDVIRQLSYFVNVSIPSLGALSSGGVGAGNGSLVLKGNTSGSVTVTVPAVAGSNTITLPAGTTDFSATGGTSRVVKQTAAGGAFTVAQLAFTDISGTLAVASGGTGDTGNAWSTYVPTITSQGGTITTSSATGRSKTIGKTVFFEIDITITNAGTGTGFIGATLPATTAAANFCASGFEYGATGVMCGAFFGSSGSTTAAHIVKYDGGTLIVNGYSIAITGSYESV